MLLLFQKEEKMTNPAFLRKTAKKVLKKNRILFSIHPLIDGSLQTLNTSIKKKNYLLKPRIPVTLMEVLVGIPTINGMSSWVGKRGIAPRYRPPPSSPTSPPVSWLNFSKKKSGRHPDLSSQKKSGSR